MQRTVDYHGPCMLPRMSTAHPHYTSMHPHMHSHSASLTACSPCPSHGLAVGHAARDHQPGQGKARPRQGQDKAKACGRPDEPSRTRAMLLSPASWPPPALRRRCELRVRWATWNLPSSPRKTNNLPSHGLSVTRRPNPHTYQRKHKHTQTCQASQERHLQERARLRPRPRPRRPPEPRREAPRREAPRRVRQLLRLRSLPESRWTRGQAPSTRGTSHRSSGPMRAAKPRQDRRLSTPELLLFLWLDTRVSFDLIRTRTIAA